MKRIIILFGAFLFTLSFLETVAQTQNHSRKVQQTRYQELTKKQIKQVKRDQRQKAREEENQEEFNAAVEALQNRNWVLMANTLYGPMGNAISVSDNTNFIQFKDNTVYVQLAFNGIAGPNGLGGITIQGTPSQINNTTDNQGNITYSFYVNSITMTAQVIITMNAGSNYANATVYPMSNINNLTFSGTLVPTSQAGIFRSGFISF